MVTAADCAHVLPLVSPLPDCATQPEGMGTGLLPAENRTWTSRAETPPPTRFPNVASEHRTCRKPSRRELASAHPGAYTGHADQGVCGCRALETHREANVIAEGSLRVDVRGVVALVGSVEGRDDLDLHGSDVVWALRDRRAAQDKRPGGYALPSGPPGLVLTTYDQVRGCSSTFTPFSAFGPTR